MLTMMEHVVPAEVYFDGDEDNGLEGARDIAVSGDGELLFVTAHDIDALSVWRVNAEAGTLSQTALYQDNSAMRNRRIAEVDGRVDSLDGVSDVAVSGDGELLFVTGSGGNTLSIWQVNAEAGTLSQTALYQDNRAPGRHIDNVDGRVDSLDGASDVAVSGDGELLFVTAHDIDALSVWRVNAEAGTLSQTAVYQDERAMGNRRIADVDGRVDGLDGVSDAAVSGDGELLFVTGSEGNTLSIWQVNAEAGTLSQTALYQDNRAPGGRRIDNVDGRVDGLEGASDVAVSGDGKLLFVTAHDIDALSVWRVNAEAGTLSQTAVYQDNDASGRRSIDNVDGRVDGLDGASDAAVSGDGKLLFVTGSEGNSLSIWQVNAEAGTLSQTALYQDNDASGRSMDEVDGQVDGLDGASDAAVSGVLLFVTGEDDDALSVWQINSAEVSLETPTVIRVQSDLPMTEEVMVTITARNGADSVAARPVTLSPSTLSADAIFPPGALSPSGRWIFTAQAEPPTALDTGAAQIAMQVLPPLLSLEPQQKRFARDSTVRLTVRTIAGLQVAASLEINAINNASGETDSITVAYSVGTTEQEVTFPAHLFSSPGQWEFSILLPDNSPFRIGDGSTATVQIVIPQLQLVPLQELFALGSTVILTVRADPGAPTEAAYEITAENLTSATTFPIPIINVIHPAGVTAQEVSFSAQQITSPGQWEFSIQLPEDSPFQVIANGSTAVYVAPVLSLRPQKEFFPAGVAVNIEVQAESPPAVDAAVTITAQRQQDGVEVAAEEAVTLTPNSEVLSGQAVFSASALDVGEWVFTAQSEPPEALYTANARTEAAVLPRPLMLEISAPPSVTVGSTFPVTVGVAEETLLAEGISVTATVSFRTADGEAIIEEIEVTLTAEQRTATEEFTAPVTAGVYTLAVSGQVEETAALRVTVTGASTSVTAVPVAVMLRLSGPAEAVSVGETYQVTVDTNRPVPEGTTLEVTVRARAGTATALQEDVSLTETISRLPVSFTAPARAGEVIVTATAMPQTSSGSRQVAVSEADELTVGVSARDVQLALSEVPVDLVAAESTFSVTVSAAPEMLAGTTVRVTVRLAAFTSESVLLTPGAPTASVLVTAPTAGGSETLRATGEEADDNRLELNVLPAQAAVQVRVEDTVELTLDAPSSVTVGSTFPVTVEVAEETPLAEDVSVTATVSFRAADGEAIIEEIEVTLTREQRTATEEFTAPVTAGVYTLAVSGQVEETAALRVTVTGASTSVTAVPVAVMLRLSGPAEAVSVGETYQVTVDTNRPVPEGTTLEVTVRARAGTATALQEDVSLTETISRLPVSFTAPARAGEVIVTATAMPQTSSGSRQVAVSEADELTVGVSARDVQLALSEVPVDLVAAESTFSVTVSAAPEMLAGTTVQVTVRLAAFTSESVLLTPGAPTASVLVTAPTAGGSETLRATGEEADDNRLELNVLGAQAAVQVRAAEGTVELTLDAPERVTVGSTFPVTVGVAEETLLAGGVSVTATVSFLTAGSEEIQAETAVLTDMMSSATPVFRAPVTAGVYTVTVSGQVEETAALRVTVTGASTSVTAVPVAVMLRLNGPAEAVSVGQDYTVMVDTTVAVPAGTTLEVTVRADSGTAIVLQEDVSLTETISRLPVSFTAPPRAGEVMVTATAMPQTSSGSRQVAVSDAMTLTVGGVCAGCAAGAVGGSCEPGGGGEHLFGDGGRSAGSAGRHNGAGDGTIGRFHQRVGTADAGCADSKRTSDGAGGGRFGDAERHRRRGGRQQAGTECAGGASGGAGAGRGHRGVDFGCAVKCDGGQHLPSDGGGGRRDAAGRGRIGDRHREFPRSGR